MKNAIYNLQTQTPIQMQSNIITTESGKEVDRVLGEYLAPTPFDPGASTRGLYLRGLD